MGIVDAFAKEDRVDVTFSVFYNLVRETAKAELLLNAVNCDVPHQHIRQMATGKKETTGVVTPRESDVADK